jgi:hypothetical protein
MTPRDTNASGSGDVLFLTRQKPIEYFLSITRTQVTTISAIPKSAYTSTTLNGMEIRGPRPFSGTWDIY